MTTDKDPTLPPLPESSMEWPSLCRYNASEVEAYGMMCRKQALTEFEPVAIVAKSPMNVSVGWIKEVPHNTRLFALKELLK